MKPLSVRRCLAYLLVAVLGIGCQTAAGQDMRPTSTGLASKITASGRKTIAVVDFTDLQGNVTELGRFLAEELSVALVGDARGFEVIDRTSLKVILQEHKLASQGLIDPATARKLGQIAGVDTLVTGTITPLGESVHVALKVLDTTTAKMIAGFTVEVPRTKAVDELLGKGIGTSNQQPAGVGDSASERVSFSEMQRSATFRLGNFLFAISGCRKNTSGEERPDQIICRGNVTNKSAQKEELTIGTESYFVDNVGFQAALNWVSIGGDWGRPVQDYPGKVLEPDLPLQFWFDSRGYSDEVVSVTIIFFANGHRIVLHNMRLQGR